MKKLLLGCAALLLTCGQVEAASFSCDNTHQCETATSGNVANATVTATLPASPGQLTFITGLQLTSNGATVANPVNCTITGINTGTQTFTYVYGTLNSFDAYNLNYAQPQPASATNTPIVVSCPASGAGGTNAALNLEGYRY